MSKPYSTSENLIGIITVSVIALFVFWFFGGTILWVGKWLLATIAASLIQTIVLSVVFIFLVVLAKRYLPKSKNE